MGTMNLKGCVYPFHVRRGKSHLLLDSKDKELGFWVNLSQIASTPVLTSQMQAAGVFLSFPSSGKGSVHSFQSTMGVSRQTAARDESHDSQCARLNC